MKGIIKSTMFSAITLALFLLSAELGCRLFGFPNGGFAFFPPVNQSPYEPNLELTLSWGPIPYVVKTNAEGFRGEDFTVQKRTTTLRILTIGDSITDGFFVDNSATWQPSLRSEIIDRIGADVEVINGARGGGSINKELSMLQRFLPSLAPNLVILTFVSNDIAEIRGVTIARLLEQAHSNYKMTITDTIRYFLLARTGLGQFLFHIYLTLSSPSYRQCPAKQGIMLDHTRYAIAGGEDYTANATAFRKRFAATDGLVLTERFTEEVDSLFSNYCMLLEEFRSACKAFGAELLLLYFPAYSQIYDVESPRYINERLRTACDALGVHFLDLTDGFRAKGMSRVLHLAPLDYHLNPAGNAVFAELVAEYLTGDSPLGDRITQQFAPPEKK